MPDVDDAAVEQLAADLTSAGVRRADVAEIADLLRNEPTAVAIAVIGEHNVGKTSLIAALTGDSGALEDIGPLITTDRSRRYVELRNGVEVEIWDTPGLGTERWEHDADTRDRITRADAVVVAISTELLDDVAREQLRHLLVIGRKLDVTLFVITKADRGDDNRPETVADLRAALAPVPGTAVEPIWTSAKPFLRSPDPERRRDSGIELVDTAVLKLATGSARERLRIRGAIRALDLIDDALPRLVDDRQPELRLAIELQQRLHRVLVIADRRLGRLAERFRNELRMRAADAGAQFGYDLEELVAAATGVLNDEIERAWRVRWGDFNEAASSLSDDYAQAVADVIDQAARECSNLDQGLLAQELRSRLPVLVEAEAADNKHGAGSVDRPWQRPGYAESINSVIEDIGRVADSFLEIEGVDGPFAAAAGLGKSVTDLVFSFQEHQSREERLSQAEDVKREVRKKYTDRADQVIRGWDEALGHYRTQAVSAGAQLASETEARLHGALGDAVLLAERLRAARTELEALIPDEAWLPAATDRERLAP